MVKGLQMPEKPTSRDPTRRARILAVAKRSFVERGFRGTTLSEVARDAGCAKGAVYLEFEDKEALLRAVVQEAFDAVRERYEAQVLSLCSPLDRLVETLAFAFREHAREPLFARLLRDDPELKVLALASDEAVRAEARVEVERLATWVDEGIACGEIRADVDRDVVPLVIGLVRNVPLHLPSLQVLDASPAAALEGVLELFRHGLAARRPAARRKRDA